MQRSEVRAAMRERRAELKSVRQRLREQAREWVARLEEIPAIKTAREAIAKRRRRNRRRTLAAIAIALLALLLIDCEGRPGRGRAIAAATPIASVKPPASPKPTPPGPLHARLDSQKRPGYELAARPGPDWLDDFRLQVSARSPRLAQCFNGSERAGTLRWTVSIDAKTGAVSDHDFEPLGAGPDLGRAQLECITRALSDPGYRLKNPPSDALPNRVSLVVEF